MHPEPTARDDVYEGPDTATVALGKGKIYGWGGSAIGIVTGVLTSGHFSASIEKYVPRATKLLETLKIPIKAKTAIRTAGGVAGSFIGHYVGLAVGVAVGLKTAHRGRDQFERIKDQRDAALAQVHLLEKTSGQRPVTEDAPGLGSVAAPTTKDAIDTKSADTTPSDHGKSTGFTAREAARSNAGEAATLER